MCKTVSAARRGCNILAPLSQDRELGKGWPMKILHLAATPFQRTGRLGGCGCRLFAWLQVAFCYIKQPATHIVYDMSQRLKAEDPHSS